MAAVIWHEWQTPFWRLAERTGEMAWGYPSDSRKIGQTDPSCQIGAYIFVNSAHDGRP